MRLLRITALLVMLGSRAPGADSLNCRLVGNWPFGPVLASIREPARDIAYCSAGGGVYVLDVANPADPRTLSEAIHTTANVRDLAFGSNTLFAANGAVEMFDVTLPSQPLKLARYGAPSSAQV